MDPSGAPYLSWLWKHTIDGIYIGEVDPFYQSCGRGILLYGNHSMNQGAYVGYWEGGVRHGIGIHLDIYKKTYYISKYYLNEQEKQNDSSLNKNAALNETLAKFNYEPQVDFSMQIPFKMTLKTDFLCL